MKYITNVSEWAAKCVADPLWLAECLQRIHRFGGQFRCIHVLGHSLEVSSRLERPIDKLWGLLHDAHEVLSGDVTRDYKTEGVAVRQEWADLHLGIALTELGVQGTFDLEAVRKMDTRVGDDELAFPGLYGSEYDCRSVMLFVSEFHVLLSECRNAQSE